MINTLSTYRDSQLIIQVFESLTEQEQVYTLKLVYRRIHPDKTKQTYQNMHQIFDDIKVLQTFMSTNGLVRYQEDKTFRAHVKLRLSGITLDDQSCLIQKSIVSIQKESRNMNLSNEWVDMVHQLMTLTLQAHKMGDLTYNNTLDILSSTAQAMTYPERSQDVSQQIEKYKDHMSEPLLQAAERFIKQVTTHAFGKQSMQEHGESDIEPSPQQKHKRILDLNSNDETDEIPLGNKPSCR
jgi:hypothetical protein